jgi:hypothetical protein
VVRAGVGARVRVRVHDWNRACGARARQTSRSCVARGARLCAGSYLATATAMDSQSLYTMRKLGRSQGAADGKDAHRAMHCAALGSEPVAAHRVAFVVVVVVVVIVVVMHSPGLADRRLTLADKGRGATYRDRRARAAARAGAVAAVRAHLHAAVARSKNCRTRTTVKERTHQPHAPAPRVCHAPPRPRLPLHRPPQLIAPRHRSSLHPEQPLLLPFSNRPRRLADARRRTAGRRRLQAARRRAKARTALRAW